MIVIELINNLLKLILQIEVFINIMINLLIIHNIFFQFNNYLLDLLLFLLFLHNYFILMYFICDIQLMIV